MQFNTNSMNQPFDTSLELHISFRARTVSPFISRGVTKRTEVIHHQLSTNSLVQDRSERKHLSWPV